MKFRTLRICLHRGWYRIVCSVSLLLIPLFCGKSNMFAATNPAQQEVGDTVSVQKGDVITGVVRTKDGKPLAGVKVSQTLYKILDGYVEKIPHEETDKPVAVTDENGAYSITVSNPSGRFFFCRDGYVIEYFFLKGKTLDIILFDKYNDFDEVYGTDEPVTKKNLQNQTAPGRVIMTAYGTPWRGPSGIEVDVERDSALSRLTQEMIERVREYEKK